MVQSEWPPVLQNEKITSLKSAMSGVGRLRRFTMAEDVPLAPIAATSQTSGDFSVAPTTSQSNGFVR